MTSKQKHDLGYQKRRKAELANLTAEKARKVRKKYVEVPIPADYYGPPANERETAFALKQLNRGLRPQVKKLKPPPPSKKGSSKHRTGYHPKRQNHGKVAN